MLTLKFYCFTSSVIIYKSIILYIKKGYSELFSFFIFLIRKNGFIVNETIGLYKKNGKTIQKHKIKEPASRLK